MFSFGRIFVLFAAIGFLVPVFSAQDRVKDPMRPADYSRAPVKKGTKDSGWQVSAILVSEGRRLAMVNNRLLSVGQTVNGARIKAIYGNAVELDVNGRSLLIKPVLEVSKRKTK